MQYFTHEALSERIIRICDISKTAAYLILGNDKNCLIDTGCGIGSIKNYILEEIGEKIEMVLLTHGHVDHASGAAEFADCPIYLHPNDRQLMRVHTTFEQRKDYVFHITKQKISERDMISQLDSMKTLKLQDGQLFDLGSITLEIVHTPGHTQGMCMVLVRELRTILFGDGCGTCVLLLDEYASTVEKYLQTLLKLKKYESMYDIVIRNHGAYESTKMILDDVIDCCQCILNGTDDQQPAKGLPILCEESYFAKALKPGSHSRADGREGNMAYTPSKIR